MPALVSHHRFAAAALRQSQSYLANAAAPIAFRWGAQGPDILFYYQPFRKNHISSVGHMLHEQRVAHMFSAMAAECAKLHMPEATAYLLGYCCHYALDRSAHPFVTYISNYRLDPLYPYLPHTALHNLCEAELDRALLDREHPNASLNLRADMLLPLDDETANRIGVLLSNAVWNVFGTRIAPKAIKTSMRSMLRIQRLLHDKSGKRASFISKVENRLGMPGAVSALIRPPKPLETDCVNSGHQPWIDAADPHIRRYTSYFDIFQYAQRDAAQLMEACYDTVQSGKPLPAELFQLNYLGLTTSLV